MNLPEAIGLVAQRQDLQSEQMREVMTMIMTGEATPAQIGGFLVGIIENLAGTYLGEVGAELKLSIALVLIILVLVVKPEGLLGRKIVQRV